MTDVYNLTNITSGSGFNGLITGINDASGGLLGAMTILSIFFIFLLGFSFRGVQFKYAYGSSTFITLLINMFMWSQNWTTDYLLIANVILFLIGLGVISYNN